MPVSGSTARRYAEAMLSFAKDERTVQQFRASLDRLGAAFDRTTVLALSNPAVPLARREAAVAARSTTLSVLRKDRFQAIVHEHPEVMLEVIKYLSQRLRLANEQLQLATRPPEAREAITAG